MTRCFCSENNTSNQGYPYSHPYDFPPQMGNQHFNNINPHTSSMMNQGYHWPPFDPHQYYRYSTGRIHQSGDGDTGLTSLSPLAKKILNKGCIPLEEIGIPGKVCIKVNFSGGSVESISIKLDIAGAFIDAEINEANGWEVQMNTGYKIANVGVSIGFLYSIASGCLSMCIDLSYLVGNVAPWYWLVGCTKSIQTP